jgi:hypothetical protein
VPRVAPAFTRGRGVGWQGSCCVSPRDRVCLGWGVGEGRAAGTQAGTSGLVRGAAGRKLRGSEACSQWAQPPRLDARPRWERASPCASVSPAAPATWLRPALGTPAAAPRLIRPPRLPPHTLDPRPRTPLPHQGMWATARASARRQAPTAATHWAYSGSTSLKRCGGHRTSGRAPRGTLDGLGEGGPRGAGRLGRCGEGRSRGHSGGQGQGRGCILLG